MGLVRRDQLVACLEFGVFDEGPVAQYFEGDDSSANVSSSWTPRPGVAKTPLMHLAYHIPDDKYEYVGGESSGPRPSFLTDKLLAQDDYDTSAWLVSVRKIRKTNSAGALVREESMPMFADIDDDATLQDSDNVNNKEVAVVGLSRMGSVYVKELDPDCKRKFVHVAAVMNRGTYCVNDFCPVSKAYRMFTNLGLRHLVVLGGESGGEVVGILTRVNFLKEYIQERTLCDVGR